MTETGFEVTDRRGGGATTQFYFPIRSDFSILYGVALVIIDNQLNQITTSVTI